MAECRATPDFHRLFDQTRVKDMHQEVSEHKQQRKRPKRE